MLLTVAQLAERIGAELVGDGSGKISSVGTVASSNKNQVTFARDTKHIASLKKSLAAAVIIAGKSDALDKPQLIVKNVDAALIEALTIFAPQLKTAKEGIDPTAKVTGDVKLGTGVSIGPYVIIDEGVQIGDNSIIGSGCKIGQKSTVGKNCRLDSNVVVYHNCNIGNNIIIQANTTIGSTGFGYSFIDGAHKLIPHNGTVVIEDCVDIGANCCIDRAKFQETRIGAGTKIDNHVQIAHNVIIGRCCLMAGGSGIGGSARLGDGVILGGHAGITDNVEVGDGVIVGANSVVMGNLEAGCKVTGTPALEIRERYRMIAMTRRLPKLIDQLKQLAARVQKLETSKDHKK